MTISPIVPKPGRNFHRWPITFAAWLFAGAALACSTVALGPADARLVAYSYDTSETDAGYVLVNPAGATRGSIMEGETARWTVDHGSITFNQFGPGMPTAGMNVAGLGVSLMWNDDARFPPIGDRGLVNELELIQMLLDRAATVDEAIAVMDDVGIQALVPIHYFIADASGATAAITPTAERMVVHEGEAMPVAALTNSSYADLIDGLSAFAGFGGEQALPSARALDDQGSMGRFAIAAGATSNPGPVTREQAFAVLADVENPQTQWQIVFAPHDQRIDFRLIGEEGQWRIELAAIDFTCRSMPLGRSLGALSADEPVPAMLPATFAGLTVVLSDVMAGFFPLTGLPPEVAGPITEAQINVLTCR